MATQVNANLLANFIRKTIGSDKIAHDKASNFKIDDNEFDKANSNDNNYLEIDEIIDNKDLYEQFATMFVEEQEKKSEEETKKEEKEKVKSKSGAGAA